MKLLADEGIDRPIVERLRQDGHEVLYVAEMERSISDDTVLGLANERQALLITADKDFGELIFRIGRIHPGVILLRLAGLPPDEKGRLIAAVLREHSLNMLGAFTVISKAAVRIRRKR